MGEFLVVEGGDEEEAEAEAFAAVSVAIRDDFEALEHGDDVFAENAFAGDLAVLRFVLFG